jgi:hypothetical protein
MTSTLRASASSYLVRTTAIPFNSADFTCVSEFKIVAASGGTEKSIWYLRGSSSFFFIYIGTASDVRVGWRNSTDSSAVQVTIDTEANLLNKWVHFAFTRAFSSANLFVYMALADGLNFASPTYLLTPSQGQLGPTASDPEHGLFASNTGGFPNENTLLGRDLILPKVLTEAEVLETWRQRHPPQYPTYLFLDLNSTTNPGTDLSGNGRDLTLTGLLSAVADEPATWTDASSIKLGSMVARDSSSSTSDHTVSV